MVAPCCQQGSAKQQRTHFLLGSALPSACPLLPQLVWDVSCQEKEKMSREQRPFPPSLSTPVAGSIPQGQPGPLCFGTCPHQPAVMATELPSPCACPPSARAGGELSPSGCLDGAVLAFPGLFQGAPARALLCQLLFACLHLLGLSSP